MALFEFELLATRCIQPWGTVDAPTLSWFALTDGKFWMSVGEQTLFHYSDEILAHWGTSTRTAEYQIAAFARDMIGTVSPATARLPQRFEALVRDRDRFRTLQKRSRQLEQEGQSSQYYTAWRWLGERSPWTSYLVAEPNVHFIRVGSEVEVHWDNRECVVDGHPVWSSRCGVHTLPVEQFIQESSDFVERLLRTMAERIGRLETNEERAQIPVESQALWKQHETWEKELMSLFAERECDVPWSEAEGALQELARRCEISF